MQEQVLCPLIAELIASEFLSIVKQVHASWVLCLHYNCASKFLSKLIIYVLFLKWNPSSQLDSTLINSESPVMELLQAETSPLSPPFINMRDCQLNLSSFLHPICWIPVPRLNFLFSTSFYSFLNDLYLIDNLAVEMCYHTDE